MKDSFRSTRGRRWIVLAIATLLAVPIAGAVAAPAPRQAEAVILQGIDATTLDPHRIQATPEGNIVMHLFDALVHRADDMSLQPGLAESWGQVNATTWQFNLRANVRFSNGAPFNAAAAAFSLQRAAQLNQTEMRAMRLAGVDVMDDQTIRIRTQTPNPIVPTLLLTIYMMEPGYYRTASDAVAATRPVGTGPYTLQDWRRDDRLVMVANDAYWGGRPSIGRLVWRPVPEAATRIAELETGNAHLIVNLPAEARDRVQRMSNAVVRQIGTGQRCYIGLRHDEQGPLQKTLVRRALNHAVDVDTIVKTVLGGFGERRSSLINPPHANARLRPLRYDPAMAKQLLAAAGYPNGFRMKLMSPQGRYPKDLEIAQAIAQYLRAVGVQATVQPNEWAGYIDQMLKNQLRDAWLLCSVGSFDGELELNPFMGSLPQLLWHNTRAQDLWKTLQSANGEAQRVRIFNDLQAMMQADPPLILLHRPIDLYGTHRDLNWAPRPDQRIYLFRRSN